MHVNQGIPQHLIIHSTNPRCLSVRWWSFLRLLRHTSYSHSDTQQMRRQVIQVQKPLQVWYVRQGEKQAENNLKHQDMLDNIRCREGLVTIRRRQWEYADMREMC